MGGVNEIRSTRRGENNLSLLDGTVAWYCGYSIDVWT